MLSSQHSHPELREKERGRNQRKTKREHHGKKGKGRIEEEGGGRESKERGKSIIVLTVLSFSVHTTYSTSHKDWNASLVSTQHGPSHCSASTTALGY